MHCERVALRPFLEEVSGLRLVGGGAYTVVLMGGRRALLVRHKASCGEARRSLWIFLGCARPPRTGDTWSCIIAPTGIAACQHQTRCHAHTPSAKCSQEVSFLAQVARRTREPRIKISAHTEKGDHCAANEWVSSFESQLPDVVDTAASFGSHQETLPSARPPARSL